MNSGDLGNMGVSLLYQCAHWRETKGFFVVSCASYVKQNATSQIAWLYE